MKYKGKYLGSLDPAFDGNQLVMNDIGSLRTLLNLNPDDILDIGGKNVRYGFFAKNVLSRTLAIYISADGLILSKMPPPDRDL